MVRKATLSWGRLQPEFLAPMPNRIDGVSVRNLLDNC